MPGLHVGTTKTLLLAAAILAILLIYSAQATASHYHTNCVGHGMVHGSSTTDGSWHARVEAGCGNPGTKTCVVKSNGVAKYTSYVASGTASTCNQWSYNCCSEQTGSATVDFNGVFSSHTHYPH